MSLTSGARVGPYEVVSPLGAGGMGEVYRARDTKLGREVAIKVLPEHLANDRDRLARFEREAQMLASLNHPHIAHLYGFEESGSARALILELVEGETLAERIARGSIPFDEALPIARQIVHALEAAHEQGIVHRDLKPANIKLTPAGVVKVLDFGLAKFAEQGPGVGTQSSHSISPTLTSPAMTAVGAILGTAAYMAPEQAKGRAVDKRSDVWAFGCVLYEMLTGRRAFEGDDVTETLASILKGQPDWAALPADVPPAVAMLLRRCLEKDRAARIGDIAAARFALENADALSGAHAVAAATPPTSVTATHRHEFLQAKRRWTMAGVAAALISGALAAASVWYVTRPTAQHVTRLEIASDANAPMAFPQGPNIAISPDGLTVVYHAQPGGSQQLMVRRLDGLESTPIPGTEFAIDPFFSPDGSRIGFSTPTQLKTVSVTGGPVTVVTDLQGQMQGASWRGDVIVFAVSGAGLFRVAAAGGQATLIAKPDPAKQEIDYSWPEVMPDGSSVLYSVYMSGGAQQARVVARRLDTGATTVLAEGANYPRYVRSGHLLYAVVPSTIMAAPFDAQTLTVRGPAVPVVDDLVFKVTGAANIAAADDGTVAYSRGASAVFQGAQGFQWLDRAGGVVGSVASKIEGPRYPRISPNGRWLVVTLGRANQGNIWVFDLTGASQSRQLTFRAHNVNPVWTPDSKYIVFTSDRDGPRNLFRIAGDGSELEPIRLTKSSFTQLPSAVTADGEWLVYEENGAKRFDLKRLNLKTGTTETFLATDFYESEAAISPDGRWVSYSTDQTGRPEVWVRPFPSGGAPIRVSPDGGREPRWSRKGNELFYQNGRKMMVAAVASREPELQFKTPEVLFEGGFVPFDLNTPRTYDVASDGRFLTIQETQRPRLGSIVVIQNWFEELKRVAPAQ